jgi:hypothetical protein
LGGGGLDAIEPGRSSSRGWGSHARGAQPASLPREVAHDGEAAHPRHRPPDCPNQVGARRSAPWTAGSHERRPEDGPCRQPPLSSTHVQQQPGSPSAAGTGGAVDPEAGGADLAPGKAAEQPPPATGRTSAVGHGGEKGVREGGREWEPVMRTAPVVRSCRWPPPLAGRGCRRRRPSLGFGWGRVGGGGSPESPLGATRGRRRLPADRHYFF